MEEKPKQKDDPQQSDRFEETAKAVGVNKAAFGKALDRLLTKAPSKPNQKVTGVKPEDWS